MGNRIFGHKEMTPRELSVLLQKKRRKTHLMVVAFISYSKVLGLGQRLNDMQIYL